MAKARYQDCGIIAVTQNPSLEMSKARQDPWDDLSWSTVRTTPSSGRTETQTERWNRLTYRALQGYNRGFQGRPALWWAREEPRLRKAFVES